MTADFADVVTVQSRTAIRELRDAVLAVAAIGFQEQVLLLG